MHRGTTTMLLTIALLAGGCGSPPSEDATSAGLENGSFHATLNGFDIHYEVHGTGPVLMTLPNSWGLSLEGLRALYRPLEQHLTMVYFDPRGMGGSGAIREEADMSAAVVRDDFDALRRHLGLDRVHVIGWSNGAMNLILLASGRPETVDKAIFLHGAARFDAEDMTAFSEKHPEWVAAYEAFQERMAEADLSPEDQNIAVREFVIESAFPPSFADPQLAAEKLPEMYAHTRFSWAHWQYSQQEFPTFDARDRLGSITAPSLVLAGAHDSIPLERAEELYRGIPTAMFKVFDHSGHFAPVEEPELFESTVLGFLDVGP
jgi:proline iminopeptidase